MPSAASPLKTQRMGLDKEIQTENILNNLIETINSQSWQDGYQMSSVANTPAYQVRLNQYMHNKNAQSVNLPRILPNNGPAARIVVQSQIIGPDSTSAYAELAIGDPSLINRKKQQLFNNSRIRQASHAAVITTKQRKQAIVQSHANSPHR